MPTEGLLRPDLPRSRSLCMADLLIWVLLRVWRWSLVVLLLLLLLLLALLPALAWLLRTSLLHGIRSVLDHGLRRLLDQRWLG